MAADDGNDRTKLRIPGAPRQAPPQAPAPQPTAAPAPPPARQQPAPPPPLPDSGYGGRDTGRMAAPVESLYRASAAFNPLLEAALPLLLLATRLRGASDAPDVEALQRRIAEQIRHFETQAKEGGATAEDVLAARYALCASVDECVLNTPWGAHSTWAAQTLLIIFHRESFGGEKFFQIVEKVSADASRYVNLMELLYGCLAIGFEGRYRLDARGAVLLAEIQRGLFERIRSVRGTAPRELSVAWTGVADARPRLVRYVPLWVVCTAALAILVLGYIGFRGALGSISGPVNSALAEIGAEPMYVPGIAAGPRLAQLLAPQIQSGTVEVVEVGNRSIVRLLQRDLFASGSAAVSPSVHATLAAIAEAVNRAPGRLMVVGHTDDQPLRSLKFSDNYELSRARAQAVADMLKPLLTRGGGVEVLGKGSEQPVLTPADRPENRARNRRVEIVHQAGF